MPWEILSFAAVGAFVAIGVLGHVLLLTALLTARKRPRLRLRRPATAEAPAGLAA